MVNQNVTSSKKKRRKESIEIDNAEDVVVVASESKDKTPASTKKNKNKKKQRSLSTTSEDLVADEENVSETPDVKKELKKAKLEGDSDDNVKDKNKPCKGNPQGVTRLFLGNLPFTVNETAIEEFFANNNAGTVTHVKWITDKLSGKFYGSAFIEMDNSESAAAAVALAGTELLGRPIKVNFAAARPNEQWPPETKTVIGNANNKKEKGTGGGHAGGMGIEGIKSAKPLDCRKLFLGNLSFDVTDDALVKFFLNGADAEVKAIRFIHHKDNGNFKGVYVHFK
jgi:nucleolin